VNASIYVVRAELLWPALERLQPHNAQGELYLTDAVRDLVEGGHTVAAHVAPDSFEAEGVNTRVELAAAAAVLRDRINARHMLAGATLVDPGSTWIEPDVTLEPDVTIHPWVYLRGRTQVGAQAEILAHTVAVDAEIGVGATVGPFCYLRPGSVLEAGSKAGTFVEIKNSRIGTGAKVPHLSYIGDAEIGDDTNVGAGAITANLPHQPGRPKSRTKIGKNVRTGIQNGFVAPVEIGDGAWTAAGTVITKDVPPDALAVARSPQENKEGYAARHRDD
jgi:bifunctional UDP-N-acetylglucosamine pyrophosphorylase/glucosamine-1-phosphate N-acetyltransferase